MVNNLGYHLLKDKDDKEDISVNAKKRQEHFEAETERILMDTYNSLYKCQEFIPMVRPLIAHFNAYSQDTKSKVTLP